MDAPPHTFRRRKLPHMDAPGIFQAVTFRLADSLPAAKLQELAREVRKLTEIEASRIRRERLDQWLDAGLGCCALAHPDAARMMQATLELGASNGRYALHAWCIMPNHVHVLIEPHISLRRIVQAWKAYSGRWALANNARLGLEIEGRAFWMRDYWDRFIRDDRHLQAVVAYIENNPVAAGLCASPEHWPWSSAARRRQAGAAAEG